MASNLKVIIENTQDKIKIPSGTRMLIRRSCNAALQYDHYDSRTQINVILTDNEQFEEYLRARSYSLEAPEVTGIPSDDADSGSLGRIVISIERIIELVSIYNQPFEMGVVYAAVHGALNLLGQYYTDPTIKKSMMLKEAAIMTLLGFQPIAGIVSFEDN